MKEYLVVLSLGYHTPAVMQVTAESKEDAVKQSIYFIKEDSTMSYTEMVEEAYKMDMVLSVYDTMTTYSKNPQVKIYESIE